MCVFLILLVILYGCLGMEPQCSKFHYEEQLLEKMIRTELKFEKLQDDYKKLFTDYQMAMVTVREVMDEVKTERKHMRDEFRKLNNTTTITIEEHLAKSKEQYQQNERLIARISDDLRGMHKNITESFKTPLVGFKATGVKTLTTSKGETLVFPTILFNLQDGYDPSTGVFTAPVGGLYLFTAQICTSGRDYVVIDIMVAGLSRGRGDVGDHVFTLCDTMDAFAYMDVGQTASISVYRADTLFNTDERINSFSGALINN